MQIKKMYQPLVDLLESNKDKQVSEILPQALEIAQSKTNRDLNSTHLRSKDGEVIAIRCYYYKRWLPLVGDKAVDFGVKKSTVTGYNTICAEGNKLWNKQLSEYKTEYSKLLDRVSNGEVLPQDISSEKEKLENKRNTIEPTDKGFESEQECIDYLNNLGYALAE